MFRVLYNYFYKNNSLNKQNDTSKENDVQKEINIQEVKGKVRAHLAAIFEISFI